MTANNPEEHDHHKDHKDSEQLAVKLERFPVSDFVLQDQEGNKVSDSDNPDSNAYGLQQAKKRGKVGFHGFLSSSQRDNPESYGIALLGILTDPVFTFVLGLIVSTVFWLSALQEVVLSAGL